MPDDPKGLPHMKVGFGPRLSAFGFLPGPEICCRARGTRREARKPKTGSCAINAINAIVDCMASITIRKLPENTKRRLRIRAARNGRSMEQEARELLETGLARADSEPENLGEAIRQIFAPLGGVNLKIPPRRGKIREISFK
jgi:antitoxin FitA